MAENKKPAETEEQKKARETVELIAANIVDLAEGVRKIVNGRLNKRAIIILLASSSRLSPTVCEQVLDAITNLDKKFTK